MVGILDEIGVRSATVMRTAIDPRSGVQGLSAWDLDVLKDNYASFEAEFSPRREAARRGAITASEALVVRTQVMDRWRQFPAVEPDLPAQLLPPDWPRSEMRSLFVELYDGLAPVATARCQQIVAPHSPEIAALVTHHTVAGAAG